MDAGGQWLDGTDVPTFYLPVSGEQLVVVFLRAGEFDEPLPLTGITDIALRAAIAGLPAGHAVRETRVGGLLSTIVLAGDDVDIHETLHLLASALTEPDETRILAELQRAKSRVDARARGPRELHFATRFGGRGPGTTDFPQYGAFKASAGDVARAARRLFVTPNAALLHLGEEPSELSFGLGRGDARPLPSAVTLDGLDLPARAIGPPGGVSASLELPRSLAGRLAFAMLARRLRARGTPGDLSAAVEQVGERDLVGMLGAPVTEAFIAEAGEVIVRETAEMARVTPTAGELQDVRAAWLAETTATPLGLGSFVVSEMLLGSRHESRSDLVDGLWLIGPDDVSLTAQLMTTTLLLLLPEGVELDPALIPLSASARPSPVVKGKRYRPVNAAIDWQASARGTLFAGDDGVSQVTKAAHVFTMLFADVELMIDYDDGVIVLVGSRSWLQVDPRLWRDGEAVRAAILRHVPADRVVLVPKGERALLAGKLAIEQERRTALRSLTKAIAILAVTITFVGLLAWLGRGRDAERSAGDCANVENALATRVDCASADADGRVLAISSLASGGRRECPPPTDDIVRMADATSGESGCLRRLEAPHPGDVGAGGGILRPGDCIGDPAGGLAEPEVSCSSERNFATIAARTATRRQCPPDAVDFDEYAASTEKPILCLARGPGVITRGDCVTDQDVTPLEKVGCRTPEAAFRVISRVAAARQCPRGADTAVVSRALPRAAIACLRRA